MKRVMIIALLAAAMVVACVQALKRYRPELHGQKGGPIPVCTDQQATIEVITVNAGLASGVVSLAGPRTAPFAREVARYKNADILCLQEVWKPEAVDEVVRALGVPANRIYMTDTRGKFEEPGKYVCAADQLDSVRKCALEKCQGQNPEQTTICVLRNCRWALGKLRYLGGMSCLNCLASSVGRSVDEIVSRCTNGVGSSRVYDGANGVILVSKYPLKNRAVLDLPSSAVNRVALLATVDIPGRGSIEVACTHLTSPEDDVPPTNNRFKTWQEEQGEQIQQIKGALKGRAGNRPALLIGDLNTGTRVDKGEDVVKVERVWDKVVDREFDCPAARAQPFVCSMCASNSIRRHDGNSRLIDHVIVRDPPGGMTVEPVCVQQVMQTPVQITGYKGETIETHVSDHYGIRTLFYLK